MGGATGTTSRRGHAAPGAAETVRRDMQRLLRDSDLEGSLVTAVVEGSGADRAGLRGTYRDRRGRVVVGDVIVAIDGQPVRSADDLLLALERKRVGDVVTVRFIRDLREERQAKVRLGPPSGP